MSRMRHVLNLLLPLSLACTATNTGNPGMDGTGDPGDLGAPEGIALVKSGLAREQSPDVSESQRAQFGDSSRQFAFDLYGQAATKDGNVFISPYSVRAALGMLYAGAQGETKQEIASALSFGLPEPALHAAFNATDMALAGRANELIGSDFPDQPGLEPSSGDLVLRVVNAAFGQQGTMFQMPYLDTLALHYGTGMFAADFVNEPERERLAINRWVEDQTNTRIKDLIPMGAIDPMVALVLVNAIYFKGSWLEPFDAANTMQETFHAPAGDVPVDMMNGFAETYAEGDGYQALALPYIAPDVRMLFILPAEGRFEEIEAGIDAGFVDGVVQSLSRWAVTLKVPTFSFESSFGLNDAMRALGMELAFEEGRADLSGIAGSPGQLYVSDILHKTFVAIDEQGTEAAAATAVIARNSSAPPPADFFLDRPFLFMIYDEPTGQVLFVGRLLDPS